MKHITEEWIYNPSGSNGKERCTMKDKAMLPEVFGDGLTKETVFLNIKFSRHMILGILSCIHLKKNTFSMEKMSVS